MFITSITNLPGYARLKNGSIYFIYLFVYLFTYLLGIYLLIFYLFIRYLFTYYLGIYLLIYLNLKACCRWSQRHWLNVVGGNLPTDNSNR